MKIKLAFLLVFSFFAMSPAFSQKTNLPPTPTPTTPEQYWAMGYETGYNLTVQGHTSTYNNTVNTAQAEGLTDYWDGLVSGHLAALQKMQVLVSPPTIQDYDIQYSPTPVLIIFLFTDGTSFTAYGDIE
jgi:hypothetical protein